MKFKDILKIEKFALFPLTKIVSENILCVHIWAKHHGMIKRKGERGARSKIQILHFADEGRRNGSNQQRGAAASQTSHFPEYV